MDAYEATKVVLSRIGSLDPENASKIMGLLLMQEHGEKEMIRLAFGPENLLHTLVVKARQELGITPTSPSFSLFRQNLNPWRCSPPFYKRGGDMMDEHCWASTMVDPAKGPTCKFVRQPGKLELCHELLRSKLMAASGPGSPLFPHPRNHSPRSALMMGEDLLKFSPARFDDMNRASRQIYLTFPADSTFREADVSNYFSIYGAVEDVRIPYQQKRMFGFVTFVYPETVKMILAKGNPHFVCDARVLVKPYKEKGKVPHKFRKQQQIEKGEFSACSSPTALHSRDPFHLQSGGGMGYDTQYMFLRRKLAEEQADLQQALEHQSRRLRGLQLLDVKRNHNHHHHHHCSLSSGAPIPSPTQSPNSFFHQPLLGSDPSSPHASDENCASPPLNYAKQALQQAINEATDKEKESSVGEDNNNGIGKECPFHHDNNLLESLDLPDSPFASPTKGTSKFMTAFSGGSEVENTSVSAKASAFALHNASTLDIPPFK